MPQVRFAPSAIRDLQRLRDFLRPKNPEAARLFATMTEQAAHAASNHPATQPAEIGTAIAEAFRVAFLSIAAFTTAGLFLALSIPLRRI